MSRGLHSFITVLLETATWDKSLDEVKVPLIFLPRVKQNKTVLNQRLFSIFLFINTFFKAFYCNLSLNFASAVFKNMSIQFGVALSTFLPREY